MKFTGERVIPGEGDADLLNEHRARYLFAQRFSAGKTVLDVACGAGYGTALLGEKAAAVFGVDLSAEAVSHALPPPWLGLSGPSEGGCEFPFPAARSPWRANTAGGEPGPRGGWNRARQRSALPFPSLAFFLCCQLQSPFPLPFPPEEWSLRRRREELKQRWEELRLLYGSLWYRIGKNLRLSPIPASDQKPPQAVKPDDS